MGLFRCTTESSTNCGAVRPSDRDSSKKMTSYCWNARRMRWPTAWCRSIMAPGHWQRRYPRNGAVVLSRYPYRDGRLTPGTVIIRTVRLWDSAYRDSTAMHDGEVA